MIAFNKEYTYQEICANLGWTITSGEAKKKQIKCIEESFIFYHPTNPKTNKTKKSYIFTNKVKEPIITDGRGNNGGYRKNAGSKSIFSSDEFDYLWSNFVYEGYRRNLYHEYSDYLSDIYFTSSLLFEQFGFDYYNIIGNIKYSKNEKDNIAKQIFQDIVYDCVKSQTISKLCKRYGHKKNSLPKGILRSHSFINHEQQNDNELLPTYNKWLKEALQAKGFKTEKEAMNKGCYRDILKAVSFRFEEEKKMYNVKRVNRIRVNDIDLKSLKKGQKTYLTQYRKNFKKAILTSVEKSVKRRIHNNEKYKTHLDNNQKELLNLYLQQLIGEIPLMNLINSNDFAKKDYSANPL